MQNIHKEMEYIVYSYDHYIVHQSVIYTLFLLNLNGNGLIWAKLCGNKLLDSQVSYEYFVKNSPRLLIRIYDGST